MRERERERMVNIMEIGQEPMNGMNLNEKRKKVNGYMSNKYSINQIPLIESNAEIYIFSLVVRINFLSLYLLRLVLSYRIVSPLAIIHCLT